MFEYVVTESGEDRGCHVPDDEFDGVWERLLAGADADLDADLDAVPDCPPEERGDAWPDGLVLAYGSCAPSGWLALDLDSATADPARLPDDTLIEAMIGFDREPWRREMRSAQPPTRRSPGSSVSTVSVRSGAPRSAFRA